MTIASSLLLYLELSKSVKGVIGIAVVIELPHCERMEQIRHAQILVPRHLDPIEKRQKILLGLQSGCLFCDIVPIHCDKSKSGLWVQVAEKSFL